MNRILEKLGVRSREDGKRLLLSPLLKLRLTGLGAACWLASLLTLVVTVPLNYLLNKLWAFKKK